MLYPDNIESKIGFDSVRALIMEQCLSPLGKEEIEAMGFSSDFDTIVERIALVDEAMSLYRESGEKLPIGSLADIRGAMGATQAEGTFLELRDVADLRLDLSTLRTLVSFLRKQDAERFPSLAAMAEPVEFFPDVEARIDSLIDKYGEVKDNASPELANIRRQMAKAQGSVSRTMQAILKQAQADGIVDKDAAPSVRDGRLVIPVAAMNKRRISGIVHDESATGKTAFIEPAALVEINNRLRELESAERREIVRILTEFTAEVRPYYPAILDSLAFLSKADALRAKTEFSLRINALRPHLVSECEIEWYDARHPLLQLSLERQGKQIEPLSIRLNSRQRILLISGPNAGGKSVCLKTVGLLQYMLQCGLPIPVSGRTTAGVFSSIFIDIGDEQSIENDLSTYSSHLLNMKVCIKNSDAHSLLLIDEFGTGTEPQLGGAIAQAVLDCLNRNGVYGVITTHYTNLKHYATETEGIVNGAMLYDRHRMQPLFRLSIGHAGSSFAIEIARKIGLPEEVIKAASDMVGTEVVDFDKHLQDVARDKRYWESKRQQIREKDKHLQQLIDKYEQRMAEADRKEKQLIKEARQKASDIISSANAEVEKTIRTIKESKADKEKTKQVREQLSRHNEMLVSDIRRVEATEGSRSAVLKTGDSVCLAGQSVAGKIVEIKGKTAVVVFGQLKSTVALGKLEKISEAQARKLECQRQSSVVDGLRDRQLNFKQEIDVRGMRVDEALQAVMYYIDDAQMVGVSQVRILHGTGTGALRQAIRDYLHQSPAVASYRDEHVQFGGAGITVVEMK